MSRFLALVLGLLVACGAGERAPSTDDGSVLSPYLTIGDKLAHDSVDGLAVLSAQVATAASASSAEPGVQALVTAAGDVAAPELGAARAAFERMSLGMIDYLEAHPGERAGLILVHCPMTFAGKGALWVQRAGTLMNPYEGSNMLHCGAERPWADEH